MDSATNVQALLQQHLEALEEAVNLGRRLEQTLAACNMRQPSHSTEASPSSYEGSLRGTMRGSTRGSLRFSGDARSSIAEEEEEAMDSRCASPWRRYQEQWDVPDGNGAEDDAVPATLSFASDCYTRRDSIGQGGLRQPLLRGDTEILITETSKVSSMLEDEMVLARRSESLQAKLRKQSTSKAVGEAEQLEEDMLYKPAGYFHDLRVNRVFNLISMAAILANGIWVGIEVDREAGRERRNLTAIVIDNVFCVWFLFELVVWFGAFTCTLNAIKSAWFVLSTFIVGLMVLTLWVEPVFHFGVGDAFDLKHLSFLQLLRLVRLARLSHIIGGDQGSPEVMFQARSIIQGMKATAPLLCFFSLIVYVFALAFRWLLAESDSGYFTSVPKAFQFLFLAALASVDKAFIVNMRQEGFAPWALFLVYTLIGNLTVAKILTGLLLQVVQKQMQKQKDKVDTAKLEATIKKIAQELDEEGTGSVTVDEFEILMESKTMLQSLADHDVDVPSFINFTRASFPQNGELFVNDLIRFAKQFCGFKPVSVKDMMNLRKLMYTQMNTEMKVLLTGQHQILKEVKKGSGAWRASATPLNLSEDAVGGLPDFEERIRKLEARLTSMNASLDKLTQASG